LEEFPLSAHKRRKSQKTKEGSKRKAASETEWKPIKKGPVEGTRILERFCWV